MYKSLSLKVALPLAIAVTAVSMVITKVGGDLRQETLKQQATQRARSLLTLTLKTVNAVTQEGHRPNLQPFLNDLIRDPDVMSVWIIDRFGVVSRSASRVEVGSFDKMFAESPRDAVARGLTPRTIQVGQTTVLQTVENIPNGGNCRTCHGDAPSLGHIFLALTTSPEKEARLSWQMGAATGAFQAVTLVLLTGLVVSVLVARPVRHLASAMARVQQGDLDVRVDTGGTREMDIVVGGFNAMVERLRAARKAEAEARQLEMERAQHLAAVGEMAAGLAHEIRNPVAGVKAAVEVLASQMPHDDSRRQILRESASELDRVDKVIKDLLNYARPRPPQLADVDVNETVRGAWNLTAPGASVEAVTAACDCAEGPLLVRADAGMIRQVVVNLILNAVQAMDKSPERAVRLSTRISGGEAVVCVRDSGPGVTADKAEAIFKPFFTTKSRGTGLGLSISRRIVEMHGGRLWLENAGEPGADFRLALPLAQAAPGLQAPVAPVAQATKTPAGAGQRRGDPH